MLSPLPPEFQLPPYRPPNLAPTPSPFRKPHSARKSLRRAHIFPYYHRLPTTATACARFRLARKDPPVIAATTLPDAMVEELRINVDALAEHFQTSLNTMLARIDSRQSVVRASLASLSAQLQHIAAGYFTLPSLNLFLPHSLAPDR